MKKALVLLSLIALTFPINAQEEIVFTGLPLNKIIESGASRLPTILSENESLEFKCTITKIDDRYYWTTRENTEVIPLHSGIFITFLAVNGSGYVRIINPEMKEMVSVMEETEEKFDYIEHLIRGLKTVTYYGKIR